MKKLLLFCNNFSEIIIKIKKKKWNEIFFNFSHLLKNLFFNQLNESNDLFLETFIKLNIESEAAQFYISNKKGNIFNIL